MNKSEQLKKNRGTKALGMSIICNTN